MSALLSGSTFLGHLPVGVLGTVTGAAAGGEKLGVLVLVGLCGAAVLGRRGRIPERPHAVLLLLALVLTPVLLVVDIWNTSPLRHLRDHPALAAGACVLGILVVLALAVLFARRPAAFALAAVFALPFRLPIASGASTANLLVPLYLVVGAGALAYAIPRLRGGARSAEPPSGGALDGALGWLTSSRGLEWLLVAAVALYAVQATYSSEFSKALQNVVFFYAPFLLLFALLCEVRWTRRLLAGCFAIATGLALLFAGVGFVEYYRQRLFLNPKLVAANQYSDFFRVNSVFFDPNIYGRVLALVMILITAALLQARSRREVLLAAAVLLWLWAGLITTFSESSMAALLLGLAVLAAWRWDTPTTIYVTLAAAILALVVVLAAPPSAHLGVSGEGGSANNATSGRASLVTGGLSLFADRPLEGFGSGSFAHEYRHHHSSSSQAVAVSASHTIPITVAAEQGIVGLALYVALLISAFAVLFRKAGRSPPRIAIAACFSALMLHTLAYADFLEDPTTWALLALGVALGARPPERPRREEAAAAAAGSEGAALARR